MAVGRADNCHEPVEDDADDSDSLPDMKLRATFGVLFGLVGFYALLGILQAASLFTGARAVSNVNFWASVSFLSYAVSVVLLIRPSRFIPSLSSGLLILAAILLAAAGIALAYPVIAEFIAADRCLDSGGSFDYIASVCDRTTIQPFIGLGWRSGFSVLLSFVCFFGSGAFAWLLCIGKPSK